MVFFDFYKTLTNTKKNALNLLFLVILAAYLRPFPEIGLMGRDETSYAFLIKHFVEGTFLDDYIFVAFHPFYSLIASPISAFGIDPELAGKIVSYTFGVLSVIPVYFIGELLFSQIAGFVAGFMTATFPLLIKWAGIVQGQTVYSFMLLTSMLCIVLFFKKMRYLYAFLAGFLLCLAYLTRAEGLGIFVGNIFTLFALKKNFELKKLLAGLAIFVLTFLIIASPYVYALKIKTGEPKFTNKLFTQIRAAVIVSYNLDYEKYNYGKAHLDEKEVLKMAIKVYPKKLWEFFKKIPDYFGWMGTTLALFCIILCFFETFKTSSLSFFIPYLYVLLILPFFFVAENYFIPYAPFLFLISGYGIEHLNKLITKSDKKTSFIIVVIIFLLIFYEHIVDNKIKNYFTKTPVKLDMQTVIYASYRDFGREIATLIKPDARIMTRFNIGAWYAKGEFVSFPDVNWEEFLAYLQQQKIDYIIIGPAEMDMRPEIYNNLLWIIKGIVKNDRFSLVKHSVISTYCEFYLVKVN